MHIIAGLLKNKTVHTPKGQETRPTSGRLRESLFNICQHYIAEAAFLDLFAGSGAIGLEAISRGARSAIFVDSSRESIRCILQNIRDFRIENQTKAICGDVFSVIKKLAREKASFDIIYADPPYDAQWKTTDGTIPYSRLILAIVDEEPLLRPSGSLFIEDSTDFDPLAAPLKTLIHKSSRKMGRSTLHHYQKGGSSDG